MKHIFFIAISALFLFSCNEKHEPSELKDPSKVQKQDNVSFEERVKLHVNSQLGIPKSENYGLKIYKAQLTEDGIEDAIITVNRLDFAIDQAKKGNKLAKSAELDFWGNYNIVFYYDSEIDQITPPLEITSSPTRSLRVSFENISSETHKDVIIDYPIRNSEFRIFLPIIDHAPSNTFQWKLYDGWGTDALEAYCFSYEPGSHSEVKDIIVKKGTLKNIGTHEDYNKLEPKITCTDEVVHRFFFNPNDKKYYTKNK